jgi:hypothetical protein
METLINATMHAGRALDNRKRRFRNKAPKRGREKTLDSILEWKNGEVPASTYTMYNVQTRREPGALSLSLSLSLSLLSLPPSLEPFESTRTSRLDDTEEIEICDDYADEIFVSFNGGLGASREPSEPHSGTRGMGRLWCEPLVRSR